MKYRPCRILRFFRRLLVFSLVLYVFTAVLLAPRAAAFAENEIRRLALKAIHSAAERILLEYKRPLENIEQQEDGSVAFIQADTIRLMQLQTQLCSAVIEELGEIRGFSVRLGSLTPLTLLSGKGPPIPLRLEPDGIAEVNLRNEFSDAGVNQTLHRICADVNIEITVRAVWFSHPQIVCTSFVLSETVIVGKVPDGWYSAYGK